jgi:hypothetical protein
MEPHFRISADFTNIRCRSDLPQQFLLSFDPEEEKQIPPLRAARFGRDDKFDGMSG